MSRYYNDTELKNIGFKFVGENVLIDKSTIIINPKNISISNNTRIDAFCLISGGEEDVLIGHNVHLAAGVYIYGSGGVVISDFAGISARTIIYSINDDYSGHYLTGPTIKGSFTNTAKRNVYIGRHVVVGAGCIILPGVIVAEGAAIGAMSLIKSDIPEFTIYAGSPAKFIKKRSRDLLKLEKNI